MHRLSKESREGNPEEEVGGEEEGETKGMTGLSAPLAVDFDLCVRPGPDASSC